jgi:hypothetical protein
MFKFLIALATAVIYTGISSDFDAESVTVFTTAVTNGGLVCGG